MAGVQLCGKVVAEFQFAPVIAPVEEYLTTYPVALPFMPSSPGAVQVSVIDVSPGLVTLRSVMVAGGVVSARVAALGLFETAP